MAMTEEERDRVVITLATLVRKMGWEDLMEVQITPEDAARGNVDPALARELVNQLLKVVRDADAVEGALYRQLEATTIKFRPDVPVSQLEALEPRFTRSVVLRREGAQVRRREVNRLVSSLLSLESQFDDG